MNDEPIFKSGYENNVPEPREVEPPAAQIRRLLTSEPYGVLCTQGEGQPYGSLVAFAFSDDLRSAYFATPVATRKYRLLTESDRVALLVDNRSRHVDDMMQVEAVTATGRAVVVERGPGFEHGSHLLLSRHPYLEPFVESRSCALVRIDIVRFFLVSRFQEVSQWVPTER